MTLRLASFGVRGLVGESMTPRVALDVAAAFGTFLDGGRVLVGRDTRGSSPMLHAAAVASLMSTGCEVVDLGVCPTPILQFSVPRMGAAGGLSISGGHNSMAWNALTLIGRDGAVLDPLTGEVVLDVYHAGTFQHREVSRIGLIASTPDFASPYFEALCRQVDVDAIRRAGLKVLVDPVGGAGCAFLEPFAKALGFSLVAINAQPTAYLAREPEPRPRSALQMASFIRHVQGDIGFLLSSDMGRLSLVTEDGEPASEEYTFALIARHVLGRTPGPVVTNVCTSRMVDELAYRFQVPVFKTPVGQARVVARLADERGVVGGEGSGSAALASFSPAFDGFLMMALVLEALATTERSSAGLIHSMPRYHMVKRAIACPSSHAYRALDAWVEEAGEWNPARIEEVDGVRLDWDDGWLHVRASHTEQLVRVISESEDRALALRRAEDALRQLGQWT